MVAVGFVEARELIGNIETTDAMLKAMGMRLIGTDTISASLVTVVMIEEVEAVKAAAGAGTGAASKVRKPLAAHVVPRPHAGIAKIPPKPGFATK